MYGEAKIFPCEVRVYIYNCSTILFADYILRLRFQPTLAVLATTSKADPKKKQHPPQLRNHVRSLADVLVGVITYICAYK